MMRQVRKREKYHPFRALEGSGAHAGYAELVLVSGGNSAYIWVGPARNARGNLYTFHGAAELRKFAKAILAEVGNK